ncbi:MAG: type II CRISPR-associated endonuclease Cas1 [Chromatiales bacterium]|nr:type II CRISPR-associated endonuclease Cas1 [Chromatiales bacterium]
MIKRTIEISNPAWLKVKHGQLLVERDNEVIASVPFEDIGMLIADHPAVTMTQAVLQHCAQHNTALVSCDERHTPALLALPISGHTLHGKVLRAQVAVKPTFKKRLWQQVVRGKLTNQGWLLEELKSSATQRLKQLTSKVKPGDPDNVEAQACKYYWPALFGKQFRRDRDQTGINQLLNYGYAIARAMTARAVVASGLHPALGLHHHNQYNAYALADDLMEPIRPLVDAQVVELARRDIIEINQDSKQALLGLMAQPVRLGDDKMPLMNATQRCVQQFCEALQRGTLKAGWCFPCALEP